jgi:hypothetical protein
MSGPIVVSSELAASVQRLKSRAWRDADARAFEEGAIPTKPATTVPTAIKANHLVSRQRQRSPDRLASRERRRALGGSGALPDGLRRQYTEGQRAVLTIIAGEVKHHGICDLPIDKIAALAGVCRTTVQTTLHEARRLGHLKITERPVRGRKSLTNLIKIIPNDWRAWISRGPAAHRPIGSKTVKMASTTKSIEDSKKEAWRGNSSHLSNCGLSGGCPSGLNRGS